ncbi:MAG: UDP-glucose/GDP-mannose dehydrogenase family protein [Candidatus Micrarchaeota archaeon]
MKIAFIGAGYVGLVSAVGYALAGNDSVCIEIDERKIAQINGGKAPIYEGGLDDALLKLTRDGKLLATSDYNGIASAQAIFICVGTPSAQDGSIDLRYIEDSCAKIASILPKMKGYPIVVVKSTVIPGTTSGLVKGILEKGSKLRAGRDFGLAMMPEFLREGTALADFKHPDRIVIGTMDEKTRKVLMGLHSKFPGEKLIVSPSAAEMIKYASNSFLATKISFVNQLALLCEKTGIDVDDVARGMGLDNRIAMPFLRAGPGFGGSCFPKDVRALMHFSGKEGVEPTILESVMLVNSLQPLWLIGAAQEKMPLKGKTICILGLAFKPDTDDVRESPAIPVISQLLKMGCKVLAYDPKGMANFKKLFPKLDYANSMDDALKGADACMIITDWKEFKKPIAHYERLMKNPLILDSRRILDPKTAITASYISLGRGIA